MEPRSLFFRWLWPIALIGLTGVAVPAHAGVLSSEARTAAANGGARPRAVGAPGARSADSAAERKLDGSLRQIGQRYPALGAGASLQALRLLNPTARFQLLATESTPRVLVDAVADRDAAALQTALERLGFQATGRFANDVGGWLPINELAGATAIGELRLMRASRPRTHAGAVTSQGDFAQRSDLVRSSPSITGLNGTGVIVGVLSGSFNCYAQYRMQGVPVSGFTGYASNGFTAEYAQDTGSGDLPPNVDVLEEANCPNYDPAELHPFGDEGRAMLQIVHDIAPNAQLAFHTAEMSEADFANGIIALANAGAKVIIDDVSYADEPFFQDGLLAQAVNQVNLNNNVAYFSSAGNGGRNSLEIVAPAFPVKGSPGAPNANEKLLNFDTSGSIATQLPVHIPALAPGEFINFVVEWDQPYVTGAPGSAGATSAIDICITNQAGTTSCQGASAVGQDPVNVLIWLNPVTSGANSAAEQVHIQIGLVSGAAPGLIKLFVDDNAAGATINAFQTTGAPTVQGHPGAAGAIAVGAANYFRTPRCGTTPATLESYSSAGGDAILFDTAGKRLSVPVTRNKPDIVAPDGVNNTFLGEVMPALSTSVPQCQNEASYPIFSGTSAAAPHAGAVAALLFQARPKATAAQVYTALRSTALNMGSAGFDFDSGNGFIQADAALTQLAAAVPAGSGGTGGSTTPPASSGGGGGSLGLPEVLLLGLTRLLTLRPRAFAGRERSRR